jgi:hypothetical protein
MKDVKDWLASSHSYQKGVSLYLKYGGDARYIRLFKEPIITDFKQSALLKQLKILYTEMQSSAGSNNISSQAAQPVNADKDYSPTSWVENTTDEYLMNLREQWRPLYGKRSNLQARIHDVASIGNTDAVKRQEAASMAAEIIRLSKQIKRIYDAKNEYIKMGASAPTYEDIEPIGSPEAIVIKWNNIKRYLRELRRKINSPDVSLAKHEKWILAFEQYSKELSALNKQLNRPLNEGLPT